MDKFNMDINWAVERGIEPVGSIEEFAASITAMVREQLKDNSWQIAKVMTSDVKFRDKKVIRVLDCDVEVVYTISLSNNHDYRFYFETKSPSS